MSINSLCCCLRADDVLDKMIMPGHHLEKLNKRPASIKRPSNKRPPASILKFEISAPGANSKIYGI